MTLKTDVYVLDDVDPHDVFHFCRIMIEATSRYTFGDDKYIIRNHLGQDLPALLTVSYATRPMTVSFDTGYGYSDDRGRDCRSLHADLVAQLGHWLDARGVRWEWVNECT